jgi:hypothetical protein
LASSAAATQVGTRRRVDATPKVGAGRVAPAPDLAGVLRSVEAITEDLRLGT